MKVTNATRYSGVMLRSIFLSVVSDVERVFLKDLPVGTKRRAEFIREHCHVEYVYTRRGGCSGRASLGGGWCRIRIRAQRGEPRSAHLADPARGLPPVRRPPRRHAQRRQPLVG